MVTTSLDNNTYEELLDYRAYPCNSWQFLYFPTRHVRYIRLQGTHSNQTPFEVIGFQAMQVKTLPNIIDEIIKPYSNVATVAMGASVTSGSDGDSMLNFDSYDFTYQLLNAFIVVKLSQPYYLSSLRILLGNRECPSSESSFYIEASSDNITWELIVDKRNESCKSAWHHFEFTERVVVYFRICGTKGDLNVCIFLFSHF